MKKQKFLILSLSILFFLSIFFIGFAWFEPSSSIKEIYIPIDNTSVAQTKAGNLSVEMIYDYNNSAYYINPSGNSNISGKIISNTSVVSTDSAKTLATKDYVDSNCILIAYNGTCPTGFSTSTGTPRGAGYKMCCR